MNPRRSLCALCVCALFLAACGASLPAPAAQAYAHVNRGAALLAAGDIDDAEANYRLALEYDNHVAEAHVGLAVVAIGRGHSEEAERHLQAALAINEDMVEAHNVLGTLRINRGDAAGAIRAFEAVLAIDPGQADARHNLAAIYVDQGLFREARAHLIRLTQYVEWADAHALRAYCEFRLGRPNAALEQIRKAIQLDRHSARAFLVAGMVFLQRAEVDPAYDAFVVALTSAGVSAEAQPFEQAQQAVLLFAARAGVVETAIARGDLQTAEQHLREAERAGVGGPMLNQLREHYESALASGRRTVAAPPPDASTRTRTRRLHRLASTP